LRLNQLIGTVSTKSYFKPMVPKLDPVRSPRLTEPKGKNGSVSAAVSPQGRWERRGLSRSDNGSAVATPGIAELWLEIVDKPDKANAVWAWIERKNNPPGVQRIGVALNRAQWPAGGALERGDKQAVRWLFGVALLERISFAPRGSAAHGLRRHIVRTVLGDMAQPWESILWAAYRLKDHELSEPVAALPIYGKSPAPGPHKIATVSLDCG
jgi:hypothetical protein